MYSYQLYHNQSTLLAAKSRLLDLINFEGCASTRESKANHVTEVNISYEIAPT